MTVACCMTLVCCKRRLLTRRKAAEVVALARAHAAATTRQRWMDALSVQRQRTLRSSETSPSFSDSICLAMSAIHAAFCSALAARTHNERDDPTSENTQLLSAQRR